MHGKDAINGGSLPVQPAHYAETEQYISSLHAYLPIFVTHCVRKWFLGCSQHLVALFAVLIEMFAVATRSPLRKYAISMPRRRSRRRSRLVMAGQPRAGKTSILYRLKLNDFILAQPTSGPLSETLQFADAPDIVTFVDLGRDVPIAPPGTDAGYAYDLHLDETNSPLVDNPSSQAWHKGSSLPPWASEYLNAATGALFVVDGLGTTQAIRACRDDIEGVLFDDSFTSRNGRLAILINKKDARSAIPADVVATLLNLPAALRRKRWEIFACSAKTGEGLLQAVSWVLGYDRNFEIPMFNPGCLELMAMRA